MTFLILAGTEMDRFPKGRALISPETIVLPSVSGAQCSGLSTAAQGHGPAFSIYEFCFISRSMSREMQISAESCIVCSLEHLFVRWLAML